jgi:hypothetical protein
MERLHQAIERLEPIAVEFYQGNLILRTPPTSTSRDFDTYRLPLSLSFGALTNYLQHIRILEID